MHPNNAEYVDLSVYKRKHHANYIRMSFELYNKRGQASKQIESLCSKQCTICKGKFATIKIEFHYWNTLQ